MTKSELKDALELFASKPDDALESTEVGAAFLGCCQRTVRYHPKLEPLGLVAIARLGLSRTGLYAPGEDTAQARDV